MKDSVDIKDFGKYLTYTSFQDALHQIRKISLERILANEPVTDQHQQSKAPQVAKTA